MREITPCKRWLRWLKKSSPLPLRLHRTTSNTREVIEGSSIHLNQDVTVNTEHYVPIHTVLNEKKISCVGMMTCIVPECDLISSDSWWKVSHKNFKSRNLAFCSWTQILFSSVQLWNGCFPNMFCVYCMCVVECPVGAHPVKTEHYKRKHCNHLIWRKTWSFLCGSLLPLRPVPADCVVL